MSERTIACVCLIAAFLGSASALGAQETRKNRGVVNPNESGGAQYHMDKGRSSMSTDTMSKSDMSKETMSKKSKKN